MSIEQKIEEGCIRIDWKNLFSDTYYSMITSWPHLKGELSSPDFKELVENYNSKGPEEYLPALGQELTIFNLLLYHVDEGADEYCLILIPISERDEFEKEAKSKRIKVELQRQPRMKPGAKAKRLDLSAVIPHEKTNLKGWINLGFPFGFKFENFYKNEGGFSHDLSFIADFSQWPPLLVECGRITSLCFNDKNSTWAAIFTSRETKQSVIKITRQNPGSNNWIEIPVIKDLDLLSKVYWIGNGLLVMYEKRAWLISGVDSDRPTAKLLLESKDQLDLTKKPYPELIRTLGDRIYVLLYSQFYELKGSKLIPTRLYPLEYTSFSAFPTGENRAVYISKTSLVEIDFQSKKQRQRELVNADDMMSVKPFDGDWAVIKRWGFPLEKIPIAQFWNPKTDEWKELRLGSLGQYGVVDIISGVDNQVLIDGGNETLIRLNKDEILNNPKLNIKNPNPWSEEWKQEDKLVEGQEEEPWYRRLFK